MTIADLYKLHMELATWFRIQARATDSVEKKEEMNSDALSLEMAATRIAHCSMVMDCSDLVGLASRSCLPPRRTRHPENRLGFEGKLGLDLIRECLGDDCYLSRLMYRRCIHDLTRHESKPPLPGKAQ